MDSGKPVLDKKILAENLAEKYGVSKKRAGQMVDDIFDAMSETLKKGGEVSISGFGKFTVVKTKGRAGINPASGEKIHIRASKAPRFRPSSTLKELVKKSR